MNCSFKGLRKWNNIWSVKQMYRQPHLDTKTQVCPTRPTQCRAPYKLRVIHKSSVVCDYCGHTVTLKMIYEAIFWNAKPLLFKKACYKHLQSQGPCTYLAVSACSWSPRTSGSSLEVSRKHTSPLLPPTQSCTRDSDRESQKKRREKAGKTGEAVRLCTWEKREKKRRGAWGNWSP